MQREGPAAQGLPEQQLGQRVDEALDQLLDQRLNLGADNETDDQADHGVLPQKVEKAAYRVDFLDYHSRDFRLRLPRALGWLKPDIGTGRDNLSLVDVALACFRCHIASFITFYQARRYRVSLNLF